MVLVLVCALVFTFFGRRWLAASARATDYGRQAVTTRRTR